MQLHSQISNLRHDLINLWSFTLLPLPLGLAQLHTYNHFFKDVVIAVVLEAALLPLVELFFELKVDSKGFGVDLVEVG